jgi:hypothetical protein
MQTTINKSELFKRAWKLYRIYGVERVEQIGCARIKEAAKSFGWCLKKAWADMKKACGRTFDNMRKAASTKPSADVAAHNASMSRAWYDNRPAFSKDRYFVGD